MLRPMVNCNLKSSTDCGNYRPIAIANSTSKLIEDSLSRKLEGYVLTSLNQFAFKPKHSTGTLKTSVFACFLDIISAYDRLSHSRLFLKINDLGVPFKVVTLLRFWYFHQRLTVE